MDRLFAILVILIIISSLFVFIKNYQDVRGAFSKELFTSFIAIYFILMLGFALLYFLLSEAGFSLLIDQPLQAGTSFERFFHSVYFSGVTLMTVGYGDVTPIGIGKPIALFEAMIGYLLPAAFLYKLLG
ncbi:MULTISPECIES: potassium channel family protein [Allobacillus]|uniref:Potassium channel family protein n=1 Tax=Allobacillus halotolerans TaxID=570278 RepID=A0ABS6GR23_9BACI|nr:MULTISPECIES: potassium channel family protein [Allobacillus]MBU6081561.1 potassium channel family protein [Allobacillus halotolerans]TSJ61243.1 two pore domain potassium channel family protein [Allobacillus sp. SKP2-8]